ncbi:MAG: glycosyltransferase family 4 protein [Gemmatimonadetes bacterium]|nr:glycosyltransferase family 4 protein [Gemmatimonadota bacterium]
MTQGPQHLLIVSHVLARLHGDEVYLQGGFGRHLDAFAERAKRVTILTCARPVEAPPDEYRLRAENVTVVPLPVYGGGPRLVRYFRMLQAALVAAMRLPRLMAQADVLHPRLPSVVGMVGAVYSRFFRGPVVYYMAGDWGAALRAKGNPLARAAAAILDPCLRWMIRNGHCFAAGEAVARAMGGGSEITPVMTTALDSSHVLDPDTAATRALRDPRLMLFVGAVWKMKGAHHFVNAVPALRKRHPELRARLIGKITGGDWLGPMLGRPELKDVVEHRPHMAWDRLMACYDEADVFVMPSVEGRGEGVPKVALEAMARGVPVVASDVGGIRALIRHESNGLLVEPGDESQLVDAVSRLWMDGELRTRLARAGVETARGYGLDQLIDRMVTRMSSDGSEGPSVIAGVPS